MAVFIKSGLRSLFVIQWDHLVFWLPKTELMNIWAYCAKHDSRTMKVNTFCVGANPKRPYVRLINVFPTPSEPDPRDEKCSAEVCCKYGRDSPPAGTYVWVRQQPIQKLRLLWKHFFWHASNDLHLMAILQSQRAWFSFLWKGRSCLRKPAKGSCQPILHREVSSGTGQHRV